MRVLDCRLLLATGLSLLLFALPGPVETAHGQSNGDGSIYSRFGLGTLRTFSSSQSQALGGGAFALRSLNYNPMGNPALWSDQVFTRFSGGGTFRQVNASGPNERTSNLNSGSLEAAKFNFPILDRKLGFAFAFQPYSESNFRVARTREAELGTGTPVPVEVNFRGGGGLQTVRAGLGYRLNEIISVGVSANGIFGILENRRETDFGTGASPSLRGTIVSDDTRLTGFTATLGTQLSFANVFSEDDALSLGIAADLPTTLDGEQIRALGDEELEQDTLASVDGEVDIPWRGRIGMAYQPDQRWTFVVDGVFEPWSNFSSDFETSSATQPFPIGGDDTLTDRWRISAGTQLVPGGGDNLAGFFGRTAYRIGGYTEQLYVQPDRRTDIQIFAGTAGISFPTPAPGTRIDLNLEAGVRGVGDAPVEETFFGVSIHVNFGERWFQQRKFR